MLQRYPEQEGITDGSETTSNEHQKLYYHLLGTSQSEVLKNCSDTMQPDSGY